jgi:hypothetical protein
VDAVHAERDILRGEHQSIEVLAVEERVEIAPTLAA